MKKDSAKLRETKSAAEKAITEKKSKGLGFEKRR